jgi:anion-transporting  ArsA/GET3 family ATPase
VTAGSSGPRSHTERRPLGQRLQGKRVLVCVGAGGVGKTTISASLALALAASGRRALVVSIDPARRLASALGMQELPGEPHRVPARALAAEGIELEGELWAMMLDPKGTFDDLIGRLAPDERAREEVLSNRIYRELSSATAGSQEFTAVTKLFDLEREGGFDTIVLDTPPSRNALDFLDAPDRLRRFLEGRALRALLRPGGLAGGLLGRGSGVVLSMLARATGVDLIGDLSTFFRSLGGMLEGFDERARGVESLLRDQATSFVIVTSPEAEPAREAAFFHARLREAGMVFGALVINRMHDTGLNGFSSERARKLLAERLEPELADRLADNMADLEMLAQRDRESVQLLGNAIGERDPVLVPELDGEVQDLVGLRRVAEHLLG